MRAEEVKEAVDRYLAELGRLKGEIAGLEREMGWQLAELREAWRYRLEPLEGQKVALEAALQSLARENKGTLFRGESDRLDLPHGALLYEVQRRVRRARQVLARLEEAGYTEAIRIAKSVDWEALERALPGLLAATEVITTVNLGISSSDIRERLRRGWPIRYQVPAAVERYIREHRLYLPEEHP